MFSRRAAWDLTPNALALRVAAHRAAGRPLHDLTHANPTGVPQPGALLRAALADVARDAASGSYDPEPRGDRAAREAIASHHRARGAALAPEHVILTAGTSEGYAHLFRVFADPGDLVHLPTPGYPLFEHLAELEGVRRERYALAPPRDPAVARWRIDVAGLARSLSRRSRAVLLIHPHNPTGSLVDPADLEQVRGLCAERGLVLVSDEVFSDSIPAAVDRSSAGGPTHVSALVGAADGEAGPLSIVLSGASKLLGVPQLKVAWLALAGPAKLRDEALARLEFAADAFLSVSPLLARTLPALFAGREAIRSALGARVAANRASLANALAPVSEVELLAAEAGWAAIVRVGAAGDGALDEEQLALDALERAGVLIHPGFVFELEPVDGGAHLVANLLAAESEFTLGAEALAAFLADLGPGPRSLRSERPR